MKTITGNITKGIYDDISKNLNMRKMFCSPYGIFQKDPNDYEGFKKWYDFHQNGQISVNPTDIFWIDYLTEDDKIVIVGESDIEDENALYVSQINSYTLKIIRDYLNG